MPQSFSYSANYERDGVITAESAGDAALLIKHDTPENLAFKGVIVAPDSDDAPALAFDHTALRPLDLRSALIHPGKDDGSVRIAFYERQVHVCTVTIEAHPVALTTLSSQIASCYQKGQINL